MEHAKAEVWVLKAACSAYPHVASDFLLLISNHTAKPSSFAFASNPRASFCSLLCRARAHAMQEAESVAAVTCLSLFTRFERLSLERIVGEERAGHMLASAKNTFLFC